MVAAQGLRNAPWWTIGLVTAAVTVLMIPGAAELLVYERSAIARGELWRLFTAHLTHYSASHLINNLLVLVFAAWLVEERYRADLLRLVALSAVAIGIAVFVFRPEITRYAGASGISLALLTYVALRGLSENRRWRIVCSVVLVMICLKLTAESVFGWQSIDWKQQAGFVTITLSHAIGVGIGLLVWLSHTVKHVRGSRFEVVALIDR